jgi:vacuolar-type H+-ATPase subunit H
MENNLTSADVGGLGAQAAAAKIVEDAQAVKTAAAEEAATIVEDAKAAATEEAATIVGDAAAAAADFAEDAKAAAAEEAAKIVEDAKAAGKAAGIEASKAAAAEEIEEAEVAAAEIVEDAKEEALEIVEDAREGVAKILKEAKAAEAAAANEIEEAEVAAVEIVQDAEEWAAKIVEEAKTAAADDIEEMKAAAAEDIQEMKRAVLADREEEKAAMEKAHDFQSNRILLNVGGHRFETSRQTLTSVPNTYLESMFSGRFQPSPDADGTYFIDRDGTHFSLVLNFLRDLGSFKLSSAVTDLQRDQLMAEAMFYGVLDGMMPGPHIVQERIGQSLLSRACLVGKEAAVRTAMAQARALIFVMGSTTPFLDEDFQDMRFVITDRIVNGSPVWAVVGSGGEKYGMCRSDTRHMLVAYETDITATNGTCFLQNMVKPAAAVAPTEVSLLHWASTRGVTLASEFDSATRAHTSPPGFSPGLNLWVMVPEMRITAVHGLDDDDPAMAAALRQLAALA